MYVDYYESPIGLIEIKADEGSVYEINRVTEMALASAPNKLTDLAIIELREYFAGSRTVFTLPLDPKGTDFQKKVWAELLTIPFGEKTTYGKLAAKINKPRAARAVGNAIGKNPLLIVIPCHRVVAEFGLGGFSAGLENKKILLKHETTEV
jgi:methylated-DNA-[protein]-cysteine S-methyltransferase